MDTGSIDIGHGRRTLRLLAAIIATGVICCAASDRVLASDSLPGRISTGNEHHPCVLLKNGNVIDGVARQVGHQVVIDGIGGQITLRYDEVACWGNSLKDLYRYRVDHREGDSNLARMADVKWCLRHGLLDQAQADLHGAHPSFQTTRQWKQLAGRVLRERNAMAATKTEKPRPSRSAVQTVGFDQAISKQVRRPPSSEVRVSAEQLTQFTREVQPMLLNRCSQCHHLGTESIFQLIRPTGSRRASAGLTQMNLTAIAPYLDESLGAEKSLYRLATEPHGAMDGAPLSKRDQTAIENLRRWLVSMGETATTPEEELSPSPTLHDATSTSPFKTDDAVIETDPSENGTDSPARLPQVEDPFDPERFNRQSRR